jgi:hypothetical protein
VPTATKRPSRSSRKSALPESPLHESCRNRAAHSSVTGSKLRYAVAHSASRRMYTVVDCSSFGRSPVCAAHRAVDYRPAPPRRRRVVLTSVFDLPKPTTRTSVPTFASLALPRPMSIPSYGSLRRRRAMSFPRIPVLRGHARLRGELACARWQGGMRVNRAGHTVAARAHVH